MEEKPVTEKRFGECRYHMHKQHMLAYLDGLFHTQFWPHSCIATHSVAIHCCNKWFSYKFPPPKIKKGNVFLKKQLCTTMLD